MNKRIFIATIVGAIISIGFITYYFSLPGKTQIEEIPLKKATIGVETGLLSAAVWVAENKGYFKEERLDLTIKEFDSGRLSFLAMLRGDVDISTVAPTPIMFKSFERQDFSVFATFVYSYDDVKVIARKESGINTAQDLKGKRVGTPAGTTGQFFLYAFLINHGILSSEIEVIDIAPLKLPDALNNGEVDAIVIWEPHAYNARKLLDGKAIRLPSSDIYRESFNFMVMKNFITNNADILKGFLRAVNRATIFLINNKEESQTIVSERLKLEKKSMSTFWKEFVFAISLDHSLVLTLEDEARWAIKSGLTNAKQIPNYLNYIYFDALKEVNPEAVTIIH